MNGRRPNRAHGAVDSLPEEVRRQILDWYLGRYSEVVPGVISGRLTYEQIAEELQKLGYKIGRTQVWRWLSRQRQDLDRIQEMKARAEALVQQLCPAGMEIEQASVNLAQALLLEALSGADLMNVRSIEDLAKVSHSLGRLQTSQVAREKWESERRKKIEDAVTKLKGEIRGLLAGRPELCSGVLEVVDEAAADMTEKG